MKNLIRGLARYCTDLVLSMALPRHQSSSGFSSSTIRPWSSSSRNPFTAWFSGSAPGSAATAGRWTRWITTATTPRHRPGPGQVDPLAKVKAAVAVEPVRQGGECLQRYFAMIRELPLDANPHDKRTWLLPNPVLRYLPRSKPQWQWRPSVRAANASRDTWACRASSMSRASR